MAHLIADAEALAALCARLSEPPVLALDTEFVRVRTYWPELALLQTAAAGTIDLIDPLAVPALEAFGALLVKCPRILMHSASEDLIALRPWCKAPLRGLYDTQIAAAFAGFGHGIGYQRLVAELLGIELPKSETRSDWMQRPLSAAQLAYAEADVAHLEDVAAALDARLAARGTAAWCTAECQRLADAAHRADDGRQPHWEFKSLWRWPRERQARLKRLLDWREQTARRINRPRLWLIDNPTAVALAENPPSTAAQLAQRLAAQRAFPRRELGPLLELLCAPVDEVLATLVPIPPPLDEAAERRFNALRRAVAARAEALDLPPALLAPRRLLERLARDADPTQLDPWRRQALAGCL